MNGIRLPRGETLGWMALLLSLVVWQPPSAFTQTGTTGTVAGHVRGPGGVSVPGATVVLMELQAGERKETWTDEAGNYLLPGLRPGTYKLEVSLLGFRADVREPVSVAPGRVLKVNVALVFNTPGEPGATPAQARGTGGPGNPRNLPEDVRARLSEFAAQSNLSGEGEGAPGGEGNVRFTGAAASDTGGQGDSSGAETDASASAANSFLLSGSVGQAPTPGDEEGRMRERVAEFRRQREGEGAPGLGGGAGGFGGGNVMFFGGPWNQRRPQINRLRGNIFERYTNAAFDARPYPLNVAGSPRVASYQEQVGVGLGGPLTIPKIYRGRDKTSFFFHYNLQRSKNPFDSFSTVPTVAEREGDFSRAVIPSGPLADTVPVLYNPFSNPSGPRTPFTGNVIPATLMDKAAVGLLPYIPLPNLPGAVQNFHLQEALPSANDRLMFRLGHQLTPKDSLTAFYFFNSSRSDAVSNFPTLTRHSSVRSQNLNLGETHTFGPHLVNSFFVNFNRQRTSTLNPFAFKANIAEQLGIQGVSQDPRDWGLPIVGFTNFAALNDTIPSTIRNQTLRLFDFILWNRGKHNVRFGGEVRRVDMNNLTDPDARGTFTFTGFSTSDFTSRGFPVAGTGFDFADFLLGLPQTTSERFGTSSNYFQTWVYSGFVQDDWRASSRLTFNLGLRYEYFQPFTEKYGHLSDLALGPEFSTVGVVTGLAPGPFPDSLIRPDRNNLAPRIGLAFRPWTQKKLVLRAGYGIFYDGSIYQRLVPNLANQPPFAEAATLLTSPARFLTLEQGFPQIAPGVTRNTYAVDPNFRTPYGQTWNFGIEEELAPNLILSLGYAGTKGTKLDLLLAPNRAAAGSPLTTQERLALRNALQFEYETSGASSIYHGLQVGLRRQFHHGFSMYGNYTFSKSIDDASSVGGAGATVAQNNLDLRAERALSIFDIRHRLVLNHIYEFPLGDGRRFLNHGGPAERVLGGWQISGVTTWQAGTPFTARILGNLSNNSGTGAYASERADASGQPVVLAGFQRTTLRYFNTDAFALPAPGEFGDAARNTIPGPRTINFNLSLDKQMTFSRERGVRGDFRIEAGDLLNTPNFTSLATVVNATDYGRVTGVKPMRSLTLSLRMRF